MRDGRACAALPKPSSLASVNSELERNVDVWCVDLSAPDGLLASAHATLSTDERERVRRFRSDHDRKMFVLAHAVLRTLLGRYLGRPPETFSFSFGVHGKPKLVDSSLEFNLSHSGEFAAYAFTRGCDLGIDIERVRIFPEFVTIAKRFFSRAEFTDLLAVDPDQIERVFFRCWTRKEAYTKAVGAGIRVPLDSFQVSVLPRAPAALRRVRGNVTEAVSWALHDFEPASDYVGALALRDRKRRMRASTTTVEQILSEGPKKFD